MIVCLSKVNGGMELASLKLARLLSTEVPVHFLAKENSFIHEQSPNYLDPCSVTFHAIDFDRFFSLKLILQARKILQDNQIRNIIFLGASEMRSLYFATLGLNINFIIRQGSKKTTPKKDWFHRLIYSNVSGFVGNCEFMRQNIAEILPIPPKASLQRIYASLKLPSTVHPKPINGTIDIVQTGRIHPGKGQFDAIKACQILHDHNIAFTLKFLGDFQHQTYYAEMTEFLQNCPYRSQVEFIGYTPEVPKYLENSDIFIFPSLGEGMSNAIIESLGYGLIPIIYDDTSSPEFLDLGFHLHLTQSNSVESLQKALLFTAVNIVEEKTKALNNIPLAQRVFNPNREKEEYLALLH